MIDLPTDEDHHLVLRELVLGTCTNFCWHLHRRNLLAAHGDPVAHAAAAVDKDDATVSTDLIAPASTTPSVLPPW